MADEDFGTGEIEPPVQADTSASYFLEGSLADPPPPEGNPAPLPLEPNEWAVEFYELDVE
jgi:hypothetical protein